MKRLTQIQLENGGIIYIEVKENTDQEQIKRSFKAIETTILNYTNQTLNAFRQVDSGNINKVTLEFGIKVGGKAGTPYITEGSADSHLKIVVECSIFDEISEDIETIKRLLQEFDAELATLENRVESLEDLEVSQVNNLEGREVSDKEIQDWIVAYLADLLEIEAEEIDVTIPFDSYGLDSSTAIGLTGDLEEWLGKKVDPNLLYDYPTVEALVQHLSRH